MHPYSRPYLFYPSPRALTFFQPPLAGEEYGKRYQLLQALERAEPIRYNSDRYTQILRDANEYYCWVGSAMSGLWMAIRPTQMKQTEYQMSWKPQMMQVRCPGAVGAGGVSAMRTYAGVSGGSGNDLRTCPVFPACSAKSSLHSVPKGTMS